MSEKRDDGGQAFPSEFFETEHSDRVVAFAGSPGMSLRDWFAGQALAGDLAGSTTCRPGYDGMAARAYLYADALLKARSS